ncbi:MAG: hypothetical protein NTW21_24335 [Verrucomicrobia bacterium]|nr:hypothetical protein [Verrucomicrobiota bacterium]
MVLESQSCARGDGDIGVFEHDGPFGGVIDAFACIGGVVRVPRSGDGLGEIDFGVCGDDEHAIRAVGAGHGDGGVGERAEGGGGERSPRLEAGVERGGCEGLGGHFHQG